ncbi:PAS/PAC sensor signal transduction histidine kinase [Trichodesmium erythraeum IMS101]|uniref:histidine kinase n=1 Tax=Trichodesmium erythraeum (strain IMS101) TaxID=203124 RepID=Q10X02_TRIEI|nr:PAS domain-containing protein [Trichodesmium erythraeum GBRTRLIN201]MCH2047371.1 ATP-binding protein [Trichodesmium sp. ALOHA_ZT_67]MDE5094511.1 ATP-binding protein [Trichodesmium sp. St11_bin5]MDT9338750.1 ATP-binding protein [Trichodesmium erythraeum 21-75]
MTEIFKATTQCNLIDHVPVGLCLLREDFVVLYWNRCLENWTKIFRDDIIGKNLLDFFPHLKQPKYISRFQQVFFGGFPAIFSPQLHPSLIHCFLPHKQKAIQKTIVNAIPIEDTNNYYALICIQDITDFDLTDRIQSYQEKLKQRQSIQRELERSNAELENFAYLASHDLQEPLRMVTTFTQMLGQRYKDQLDEDANQIIDFAVDGAIRMQSLINDLLLYSRVGRQSQFFEQTDCEEVLDTALSNLQLLIEETNTHIYRDPLPTIMADKSQLIQLFQNILNNAIKYRREEPPKIEIGVRSEDYYCLFSIKDNGIGISKQYFERIFMIFQRLHTRQEYPGTGIGLAICQKITQRHQGKIWLESELGKGSTFYFTIPQYVTE